MVHGNSLRNFGELVRDCKNIFDIDINISQKTLVRKLLVLEKKYIKTLS